MSDIQSKKEQRPVPAALDEYGPAARLQVCWSLAGRCGPWAETPAEEIAEILDMLALLPGQEELRVIAGPLREHDKEVSPCSNGRATPRRGRKLA